MKKFFFLAFIISSGLMAILTCLFVILYFRVFPHLWVYVYPLSFVFGIFLGILFYVIVKKFVG
ncbi:MAG: hypothetical protein ACP5QT_01700 [Brevinematia bacterium]